MSVFHLFQFRRIAFFNHPALIKDDNLVGVIYGSHAMGDLLSIQEDLYPHDGPGERQQRHAKGLDKVLGMANIIGKENLTYIGGCPGPATALGIFWWKRVDIESNRISEDRRTPKALWRR